MPDDLYQKYLATQDGLLYKTDETGKCRHSLGVMAFLRMIYDNVDLAPLKERLEREIEKNPRNAAALLDSANLMFMTGTNASSSVKFINGINAYALERQQAAFNQTVFFKLGKSSSPKLRLLALAAPGEISGNTPIEFLVQNAGIDLTYWYVLPNSPEPASIPEHDIAIVIASVSDFTKPHTDRIHKILQNWPKPVINRMENMEKFSRSQFFTYAQTLPNIYIPETKTVLRSDLAGTKTPYPYPFIIRPTGSFAGRGLSKIEEAPDLVHYLNSHYESEFFVSPFIDYSSKDGLFRKYRIAVIDGKAFPSHMAISEKWALWYCNAGMADDKRKQSEENDFLLNFDKDGLGKKYGDGLRRLAEKIGSEYFVIDCAETKAGELLIFEGGHDMLVHDMDSPVHFPVKYEQMQRLFCAFQTMLYQHRVIPKQSENLVLD